MWDLIGTEFINQDILISLIPTFNLIIEFSSYLHVFRKILQFYFLFFYFGFNLCWWSVFHFEGFCLLYLIVVVIIFLLNLISEFNKFFLWRGWLERHIFSIWIFSFYLCFSIYQFFVWLVNIISPFKTGCFLRITIVKYLVRWKYFMLMFMVMVI